MPASFVTGSAMPSSTGYHPAFESVWHFSPSASLMGDTARFERSPSSVALWPLPEAR